MSSPDSWGTGQISPPRGGPSAPDGRRGYGTEMNMVQNARQTWELRMVAKFSGNSADAGASVEMPRGHPHLGQPGSLLSRRPANRAAGAHASGQEARVGSHGKGTARGHAGLRRAECESTPGAQAVTQEIHSPCLGSEAVERRTGITGFCF